MNAARLHHGPTLSSSTSRRTCSSRGASRLCSISWISTDFLWKCSMFSSFLQISSCRAAASQANQTRSEGFLPEAQRSSHLHVRDVLLVVEGMALSKQGQFGPRPAVHLPTQTQLLVPQLQPHPEVVHTGVRLLRHLHQQHFRKLQPASQTWNFISFLNKNTSNHKSSSNPPAQGAWPNPNQLPICCSLGGKTLTSSQESMRASASASKEAWLQSASFLRSDWSCLLTLLISSIVSPRPASPSLTSQT